MTRKIHENQGVAVGKSDHFRNPYQVMDFPDPNDQAVVDFAASTQLDGSAEDDNARVWPPGSTAGRFHSVEGIWFSRWNGGVDPTISGDAKGKWKQGSDEVRLVEDRVYLLLDWNSGARRGLIDAKD